MHDPFDHHAFAILRKQDQISAVYGLSEASGKIVPAAKRTRPPYDAFAEASQLFDE